MDVEQAILEVCQRFCSDTGDAHDDACVVLRDTLGRVGRDEHWGAALDERARWNARRRGEA